MKSRSIEEERNQRTLKPTVIIGLGGTGCEIGARLKKALESYYRQLDIAAGMYQYVMLDAEPLHGHEEDLVKKAFAEGQEYFCLGNFVPEDYLGAALHRSEESDLARWWDTAYRAPATTLQQGCKSVRQMGRLCLYRSRDMVTTAIRRAANRARELNDRLVQTAKLPQLPQDLGLTFYVITGACGGTGSGMFLDVCYLLRRVARDLGVAKPTVRAVILMPTLYVERALLSHPEWGPHYQANAYAFFRELHHFILHGRDWHAQCMDADRLRERGVEAPPEGWKPADRFYLMDNLVEGQTLADLKQVFTLSADSLFHLIATPCGLKEEGRALVGVEHFLDRRKDGKARAFSSLGVAYVIYPAKTIVRVATAGFLADIVNNYYLRPLAPEDKKAAQEVAGKLFSGEYAEVLNATRVAAAIRKGAGQLEGNLRTATEIERNAERRVDGKKLGFYAAMEAAQQTCNSLLTQAAAAIERAYNNVKETSLPRVDELIRKGVNGCFEGASALCNGAVLTRLKELVEANSPPAPASKARSTAHEQQQATSGRAVAKGDSAESAKREVQRIESDWVPNQLQKRALRNQVRTFVTALQNNLAIELDTIAAGCARQYQQEVLARLEAAKERSERLCQQLASLAIALAGEDATDWRAERDENYLVATAQLVPSGGVPAAAEALRNRLAASLSGAAKELLARLAENNAFWFLGAQAEPERQSARYMALETMLNWVLGTAEVSTDMRLSVHQVAMRTPAEAEDFKRNILPAMENLSDPSWELAFDRAAMNPSDTPRLFSLARPDGFPKEVLPTRLLEEENFNAAKPIDPRRILVLQSQHAAPLHAVIGMNVFHGSYREWLASKDEDRASMPLHMSVQWKKGGDLEDVFPPQHVTSSRNPEAITYFTLGHFSEWLVAVKKHEAASGLVENWPQHGYIYSRGKNKFYAVAMEKATGGRIRRAGHKDKWLNEKGGRAAALGNFDDACVASGKLYIEALHDRIAWADFRALLSEYFEYLQAQIEGSTVADLKNLLIVEQAAIKEYMEEAEG